MSSVGFNEEEYSDGELEEDDERCRRQIRHENDEERGMHDLEEELEEDEDELDEDDEVSENWKYVAVFFLVYQFEIIGAILFSYFFNVHGRKSL